MASSDAGVSYPELIYVRRRFLQKDALREAIRRVVNATLTARLPEIWGEITTACASDAKHYGVWDQNLMTEYHARYRKAGVTIYWHSANELIFYSRSGEIASHRLDDQELAMLALHLLQACLVYINTLMLQQVLAEPTWLTPMSPEDFRALTPLIDHHVNPYGIFELDPDKRLAIEPPTGFLAA